MSASQTTQRRQASTPSTRRREVGPIAICATILSLACLIPLPWFSALTGSLIS